MKEQASKMRIMLDTNVLVSVLYTAIMEDVDILITGDKDFSQVKIEKPVIFTPAAFAKQYL